MATSPYPIAAQSVVLGIATLTSPTPVTSRANITGTTGLTKLTDATANGLRADTLQIKCKGTSVATQLFVWVYNGTTSFLIDEVAIPSNAAGNLAESAIAIKPLYGANFKATDQLYISVTVAQDLNAFLFGGAY
jgi:hypothetical protein